MLSNTNSYYNYRIVKMFTLAAVFWGIIGFTVGVLIASQMAFPILNFDWQYTSFGRLRPLHTSAVIFAFGGNVLFATSFFVVQRTSGVPLWGGKGLHNFIFFGYNY